MSFLVFAAALLAVFFVWGLLWPRSQWQVLASWSRRNPDASEPGSTAYAFHRILSGLGVVTFVVVGAVAGMNFLNSLPAPEPPKTALQQMWGTAPSPVVLDRIVQSAGAADPSLVAEPLIGYQVVDNVSHTPRYLAYLDVYDPPGPDDAVVGTRPSAGFAALDSAELVVNVRLKSQCAPLQAVIFETETIVQVGIFSGIAAPVGGQVPDHSFCVGGSTVGPSLLIPINLSAAVGEREVQLLDGAPLPLVDVITAQ